MRTFTVPPGSNPVRVDVFLARHVPGGARRRAQRALQAGAVRVNGRRVRKSRTVAGGDVVEVADEICDAVPLQPNPELAIAVLYVDDDLLALDKPAGLPSHALRSDETQTAANFLLARYPELVGVGKRALEPGLVHRLDTDTSGVLLVARTPEAYRALRQQFTAHAVMKEYLALVEGDITTSGEVRVPIAHDRHNRRKMRVWLRPPGPHVRARAAITSYRPLELLPGATLLQVRIATGVMHQIRVHLASIGHPILGDRIYNRTPGGSLPRHLLHACRITFRHPRTGERVEISSPLPPDFTSCLETRRHTPPIPVFNS